MFEFTSRVRYSEVDPDLKMNVSSLMNRFQDASVFHSESIGRGPKPLGEVERTWIIVSWQIIINRMPRFNEEITTSTWGWKFRGIEGDRDFQIQNSRGEVLAMAASRWIYYDFIKGLPMRVPQEEIDLYGVEDPLEIERAPRRIRIPKEAKGCQKDTILIGREHLDNNQHVNNLQYIEMAMEEAGIGSDLKEVHVEYSHQAYLGEHLTPTVYESDHGQIVKLSKSEKETCAIVEFLSTPHE